MEVQTLKIAILALAIVDNKWPLTFNTNCIVVAHHKCQSNAIFFSQFDLLTIWTNLDHTIWTKDIWTIQSSLASHMPSMTFVNIPLLEISCLQGRVSHIHTLTHIYNTNLHTNLAALVIGLAYSMLINAQSRYTLSVSFLVPLGVVSYLHFAF